MKKGREARGRKGKEVRRLLEKDIERILSLIKVHVSSLDFILSSAALL